MTDAGRVIERYGGSAVIFRGEEKESVKAIIQPALSMDENSMENMTPLGMRDYSGYFAVLPPDAEICRGDGISWDGRDFYVIRSERLFVNGVCSHVEAVLRLREEVWDG